MIPNNNFYGKKHGKTIRDFTVGLDYKIDSVEDRVELIKEKVGVTEVGGVEFPHEYFVELFDQTFDSMLDKDGAYWVEEEKKHMNYKEFTSWCKKKNIDISEYLDIQTVFDEISDGDDSGEWEYSNINTSSVKLVLNSTDAQYSETNIAKELTKMADYILAKDKREKDKVKIYSEKDFIKRLAQEKQMMESLEKVNDDEFAVLKRVKNYRLAPKLEVNKSDFKLKDIYKGEYEDYLEHWKSHQYKIQFVDGKYKKNYIDEEDFNSVSTSVCMTRDEWKKGRLNNLEKINLLNQADVSLNQMRGSMNDLKQGSLSGGFSVSQLKKGISEVKDYMNMVKQSYDNYVCITPEKCSEISSLMDIVDYSNNKHIEVLMSLPVGEQSISSDISILTYDINKAIERAFDCGDLDKLDMEIIGMLRQSKTKRDISKKISLSRVTVHKKVENITSMIVSYLN